MRRYVIYLLDKEVAHNYCGKEEKLYQLFLEAQNKISPYNSIVKKQIKYITNEIPVPYLHHVILTELNDQLHSYEKEKSYEIFIEENNSRAVLITEKNYLSLYAYGSCEAESVFFEALRKFEPSFLAIDFKHSNYGWLNPIKRENLV
ncbi:sporulation inhibitor of replication protein SirA [Pueribacillus theae]|uniref:Sporulation inhibitor of replication protein SirA n=1 Tax=Pueribacillus theae TaxID=2171751 RepID=A0A2U1K7T6_9BACI|nr:sporulation inhibitor of replication protein SirA [Pueribacillus theae]PWA13284.1 sporulation inhibitor of replication protein SirA [Pueribacillus theae]